MQEHGRSCSTSFFFFFFFFFSCSCTSSPARSPPVHHPLLPADAASSPRHKTPKQASKQANKQAEKRDEQIHPTVFIFKVCVFTNMKRYNNSTSYLFIYDPRHEATIYF
jgi:hypothetical protein